MELRLLTNTARFAPSSGGMTSGSAPVPGEDGRGRSRDQQEYGAPSVGVKTARGHNDPVRNGGVSFWWQQVGLPSPADRLDGDVTCDVAIVGAGLAGLWTALYLHEADPTLDIRIVEAEFAGFGASGRNGGWLSSELPGNAAAYADEAGEDGVARLRAAVPSPGTTTPTAPACTRRSW